MMQSEKVRSLEIRGESIRGRPVGYKRSENVQNGSGVRLQPSPHLSLTLPFPILCEDYSPDLSDIWDQLEERDPKTIDGKVWFRTKSEKGVRGRNGGRFVTEPLTHSEHCHFFCNLRVAPVWIPL